MRSKSTHTYQIASRLLLTLVFQALRHLLPQMVQRKYANTAIHSERNIN